MKQKLRILLTLLLMLSLLLCGCAGDAISSGPTEPAPSVSAQQGSPISELVFTTVDVGHGDFLLLQQDGKTMVVDSGDSSQKKSVKQALERYGVKKIDILILTHPHSDHIGNATYLIENYPIDTVYLTEREHTTKLYDKLLDALLDSSAAVKRAKPGVSFFFGNASCEFLGPLDVEAKDINNSSAVLRITHGQNTFLLTGDLEETGEPDYIRQYGDQLQADVLKLGHHATDSTTDAFFDLVSPSIAVVSTKPLSEYKNQEPKRTLFARIERLGTALYRTDQNGDIAVVSDGLHLTVHTQR